MKRFYPVLLVLLIAGLSIVLYKVILSKTDNTFVYTLDDAYIHMELAGNLADYGIMGLQPGQYTPATSAPLWTMVLSSGYYLSQDDTFRLYLPLIMNLFYSIAGLLWIYFSLKRIIQSEAYRFWICLIAYLAGPLAALQFSGMEHVMHSIFSALYFIYLFRYLNYEDSKSDLILIIFFSILLPVIRLESVFFIFSAGCMFILTRRYWQSLLMWGLGAIPVIIQGFFSISKGWSFFPSSIITKANLPGEGLIGKLAQMNDWLSNLYDSPVIMIIIIFMLLVLIIGYNRQEWRTTWSLVFVYLAATFMHLQFSKIGWFFRYESYLVFNGILISGIGLYKIKPIIKEYLKSAPSMKKIGFITIVMVFLMPFGYRFLESTIKTPRASENIYNQQIQLARYINDYHNHTALIINDIGAISYFNDIDMIDIWGLGTKEITEAYVAKSFNSNVIETVANNKNANYAIYYSDVFAGPSGLADHWIEVATLTIPNNYVCASAKVDFAARDSSYARQMENNLRSFRKKLPDGVKIEILFENN